SGKEVRNRVSSSTVPSVPISLITLFIVVTFFYISAKSPTVISFIQQKITSNTINYSLSMKIDGKQSNNVHSSIGVTALILFVEICTKSAKQSYSVNITLPYRNP